MCNLFIIFAYNSLNAAKTAKLTLIFSIMKNYIVLLLLSFAFMLGIAASESPSLAQTVEKKEVVSVPKTDLQTSFVGMPKPQTEPSGITAKFRSLRLNLFLWKEQLRANKHENLSHNAAKSLGFNRNKEVGIWDFTSDLKSKETANKALFETPDYMWSDSKIATK